MKHLIFSVILFGSFGAFAQTIGQAGCGLGNQILGAEPGPTQIIAATSNGIYGNQTSGITSGTSNCVDTNVKAALENFVEANQIALNNDISRGQGETVSTLSHMLSCANHNVASQALQANYAEISQEESASAMTAKIVETLRQSPVAGCRG